MSDLLELFADLFTSFRVPKKVARIVYLLFVLAITAIVGWAVAGAV